MLRLSFILTKGQFEVDVVAAKRLKYDVETTIGEFKGAGLPSEYGERD